MKHDRTFSLDDIDPDTGFSYGELIALAHDGLLIAYQRFLRRRFRLDDPDPDAWVSDDLHRKALGRSDN